MAACKSLKYEELAGNDKSRHLLASALKKAGDEIRTHDIHVGNVKIRFISIYFVYCCKSRIWMVTNLVLDT